MSGNYFSSAALLGFVLLSLLVLGGCTQDKPVAQVSTSATGTVEALPDMAILQGRVVSQAKSSEEAARKTQVQLDKLIGFVQSQQVANEDLQAASVLVTPEWHYPKDQPREVSGYRAVAEFTIKLRQLDKLSDLYSGLFKAGATELNPAQFDFSQREALELQAIEKAVALAKRKAEAGLKPLQQQMAEVLSMNVDTQWQSPGLYKARGAMMMSESADAAPQVNVGNQTVQASVSVTFAVK